MTLIILADGRIGCDLCFGTGPTEQTVNHYPNCPEIFDETSERITDWNIEQKRKEEYENSERAFKIYLTDLNADLLLKGLDPVDIDPMIAEYRRQMT